ncbi:hypothetical protein LEP1GSC201_2411 [Leptospira interrogans serovar Pomona str. Fox 32256]|nr:hypothetical protein LEP1GSC201_4078 [Leptospira interrogans serovar Pomona str. Fox 32256]EMF32276.1 hypothetical protein LEP1GSC201_2414 [Leptospira interrogans serovar Pomona str. Fox 32256]EMF33099.1 hypothetical protein LEP1GSC201_2411 [Leptospira interrogans serovar Pomona str. Fox 32256]
MEGKTGETSIEVKAACVTVKSVDPCIPPMEAVTLTFPWLSVEANRGYHLHWKLREYRY